MFGHSFVVFISWNSMRPVCYFCSFYFKIGACRHGDRCSRLHNKPTFSQVCLHLKLNFDLNKIGLLMFKVKSTSYVCYVEFLVWKKYIIEYKSYIYIWYVFELTIARIVISCHTFIEKYFFFTLKQSICIFTFTCMCYSIMLHFNGSFVK